MQFLKDVTLTSGKIHAFSAAGEQLRLGYDLSNYLTITVDDDGDVLVNATGDSPTVTFSDPVFVLDEAYGAGWDGNFEVPTKNAIYDKIESLDLGLTIGDTITSGTNDRVLYQASGNLAQSPRFLFDGTDLKLVNPTAGTSGTPTQPSPYLYLNGEAYDARVPATQSLGVRVRMVPAYESSHASANTSKPYSKVVWEHYVEDHFGGTYGWQEGLSYGFPVTTANDSGATHFFVQLVMKNPSQTGWGAIIESYLDGTVSFKKLDNSLTNLSAESLGHGNSLGYHNFYPDGYNSIIRTYFNSVILLEAGLGGVAVSGAEYVNSKLSILLENNKSDRYGLRVQGHASQSVNIAEFSIGAAAALSGVKSTGHIFVPDDAYDATGWNGNTEVPTKNAVRDKIESLSAGSGITRSIVVTSGNATMGASAATDYVYLVAGAHTMTLPTAVSNTNRYTVKNNHSANITVNTTSSQTIDGTTSISLAPEEAVDLISDNSNWSVI